jgi:signal transduction histidine kinase
MPGPAAAPLRDTHILAVDDKPANLLALEAVLEPLGVPVVPVTSGTDALRHAMLHGDSIAVILLDVHMPGLDGFETAQLVRGREAMRDLPIIFITAVHREEAEIVKGYAYGAVDYVLKPFNPDVLRAKVAFFVEARRRARAESRDRELYQRRLALAVEAGNLGIWTWNASSRDVECDRRCRAMLGVAPDETLGLAALGLRGVDRLSDGMLLRGELRTASGTWVRTQGRVYGEGADAWIVGIAEDISNEKQVQLEREVFIGVLGHDLRTPLSIVTTEAAVLAERGEPGLARSAERLTRCARRMAMLVANMLDLVTSRAGTLRIDRRDTDLNEICREVIAEVDSVDPSHAIRFEAGNAGTGAWDRDRLAQVVQNLITNAVRHASAGTVVRVAVRDRGPNVELDVHNDGPAIPAELQDRIFEPFVSTSGGPGLGLFVVKRLVEAHGGSVDATCDDGHTTFEVVLPRQVDP